MDFKSDTSVKFDFDDGSGWVKIKPLTPAVMRKIEQTCTERKVHRRTGKETVTTDEEKQQHLQWAAVIDSWDGVSLDGVELECTFDNKIEMMDKQVEFTFFIGECMESLNEVLQNRDRDQEKN